MIITVTSLEIPDLVLLTPSIFEDERGYFFESFNTKTFFDVTDLQVNFVQDNQSFSKKNVIRGLHWQTPPHAQAKLIRVLQGEIFDVAVDIRPDSPTFGQWASTILSAENKKQLWIPEGFAHGFLTLSDTAEVLYKTSDFYAKSFEHCMLWNDPTLSINWPLNGNQPIVSEKDQQGVSWQAFWERF